MPTYDDHLEPFKKEFDLDYQIDFLRIIDSVCSLAGKRVLEIGGSNLPRSLLFDGIKASQWICVDDVTSFSPHNHRAGNNLLDNHFKITPVFSHADDLETILARDHAIIDGDASGLRITNYFDVVISICAFEHIHHFASMLDRVHDSLRAGGQLVSLFQPIWSTLNGHHMVGIVDQAGNKYDYSSDILPNWAHLILTPPQMYQYLLTKTDPKCASDIVYAVYSSPMINRLFYEDYVDYVKISPFREGRVSALWPYEIPPETLIALKLAHPGRDCFDASTILIHAVK